MSHPHAQPDPIVIAARNHDAQMQKRRLMLAKDNNETGKNSKL